MPQLYRQDLIMKLSMKYYHKGNRRSYAGFRSREPAIKIDGSETLRHPVDILLLELMKAYIF